MSGRINSNEPPVWINRTGEQPAPRTHANGLTDQLYDLTGMSNPFVGHLSVEAELFQALALQKGAAEGDLYDIIGRLRDNNAKKAEVRKLQSMMRQMESLLGHKDKQPSAEDLGAYRELEAGFQKLLDDNGWSDSALAKVFARRPEPGSASKEDVAKWAGDMKDEIDGMAQHYSELGEGDNIALQLALSKKSTYETALSNSMKSMDESGKRIVGNIG